MKPRTRKLTKTQQRLVDAMKAGTHLRVQKADPLHFLDGANAVNARTVKTLLERGVLEPAHDGLFGDTQTLVLKKTGGEP